MFRKLFGKKATVEQKPSNETGSALQSSWLVEKEATGPNAARNATHFHEERIATAQEIRDRQGPK